MKPSLTVAETIARLPVKHVSFESVEMPIYTPPDDMTLRYRAGLAVASMTRHTSDEGWQLFKGLEGAGYTLFGDEIETTAPGIIAKDVTDVAWITRGSPIPKTPQLSPHTVVLQDKREWEGLTADRNRDPRMAFKNVGVLRDRPDIFKLTVLKDAHNDTAYHAESIDEMGCHAVIHYYSPAMICHVAPYLRSQHLIRTWHTVDKDAVPAYSPHKRSGAIISGARNPKCYPLRERLINYHRDVPELHVHPHPGYHRQGCCTPEYLQLLSCFKVAICTSSIWGYALRKLVEATACGCVVVTDLPSDEVIPEIDGNLVKIHPDSSPQEVASLVRWLYEDYNPEEQEWYARQAVTHFDFRSEGVRLADAIEQARREWKP